MPKAPAKPETDKQRERRLSKARKHQKDFRKRRKAELEAKLMGTVITAPNKPGRRPRTTLRSELVAAREITTVLRGLDNSSRDRVMEFVRSEL